MTARRCDAAAIKFNIERLMDKQRNPTNRPLWDPVAGVDTPDAGTVVMHLSQPFATMPNSLAHPSGVMVSPAAVQKYGETGIAKNPVGAGPYRMASFDPGQQLVLEAFDGYWGGKPKTAKLTLKTITGRLHARCGAAHRRGGRDRQRAGGAGVATQAGPERRDHPRAGPSADRLRDQPDTGKTERSARAPGAEPGGAGGARSRRRCSSVMRAHPTRRWRSTRRATRRCPSWCTIRRRQNRCWRRRVSDPASRWSWRCSSRRDCSPTTCRWARWSPLR